MRRAKSRCPALLAPISSTAVFPGNITPGGKREKGSRDSTSAHAASEMPQPAESIGPPCRRATERQARIGRLIGAGAGRQAVEPRCNAGRGRSPLIGVLRQEPQDQFRYGGRDLGAHAVQGHWGLELMAANLLGGGASGKRRLPGEQEVEDAAER